MRQALGEVPAPAHVLVDALTEDDLDTLARALLLKSGNFGPREIFDRAWDAAP